MRGTCARARTSGGTTRGTRTSAPCVFSCVCGSECVSCSRARCASRGVETSSAAWTKGSGTTRVSERVFAASP